MSPVLPGTIFRLRASGHAWEVGGGHPEAAHGGGGGAAAAAPSPRRAAGQPAGEPRREHVEAALHLVHAWANGRGPGNGNRSISGSSGMISFGWAGFFKSMFV